MRLRGNSVAEKMDSMSHHRPNSWPQGAALALVALLFSGCASTIPATIRSVPPGAPSVAAARAGLPTGPIYVVRWGGDIATVENFGDHTDLQIVDRPLDANGQPKRTDASEGRFLARIPGFLDPEIYQAGRELTVVGTLDGTVHRTIGQYNYALPLVKVQTHYLWQQRPLPGYYPPYDPWYGPFYDPWWPGFGSYPYRSRYW